MSVGQFLAAVCFTTFLTCAAPRVVANESFSTLTSSSPIVEEQLSADKAYFQQARQQAPNANSSSLRPLNSGMKLLLAGYCLAIVCASVVGGWVPTRFRLSHTRMQTIISFVGGLMLGIGVFHLLPHSTHALASVDSATRWMMCGIVAMFFLIRTFHFHHHGPLEVSVSGHTSHQLYVESSGHLPAHSNGGCDHDHDHDHDHDQSLGHNLVQLSPPGAGGGVNADTRPNTVHSLIQSGPPCGHAHKLSWLGIAIGLSIHTLIDGIALAASVQAEASHPIKYSLFGVGTFLAIMLHKPLDAVSITSLMAAAGWADRWRHTVNGLFSMMCPAGAVMFLLGITQLGDWQHYIVGATLAFSAGVFICISLSDLLPEMEFHAHNRARLTLALMGGILLAFGITFLEPGYLH